MNVPLVLRLRLRRGGQRRTRLARQIAHRVELGLEFHRVSEIGAGPRVASRDLGWIDRADLLRSEHRMQFVPAGMGGIEHPAPHHETSTPGRIAEPETVTSG